MNKGLHSIKNDLLRLKSPQDSNPDNKKYETIKFSPTEDKQTLFESLIPVIITQLDKTELYVNGVRYNNNIDYIIEAYNLTWNNPYPLSPKDNLVFVYR